MSQENPLTPMKIKRYNGLWLAMPNDPRGWWIGHEIDLFMKAWKATDLPELTMFDATGERLTLWCAAMGQAAELVGMNVADWQGFEIVSRDYVVAIVQDDAVTAVQARTSDGSADA